MTGFDRRSDPDRPGQLLLRDGRAVALVYWAHDFRDRAVTGWYLQPLEPGGEASPVAPRRLPPADDVRRLVADRGLDRAAWIAQAGLVELTTANAALAAAERALGDDARPSG